MRRFRTVRMNQPIILLTGMLALLGACATPGDMVAAPSDEERVRTDIGPLFAAMQNAANVNDAETHLAYYARDPGLTFVVNGAIIRGWDNLLSQQRKWWPGGRIAPADAAHQPYPLIDGPNIQVLGLRSVMVTFVVDARRLQSDRVMRRRLAITQLWAKRPEGWRIVHAHESLGPERLESDAKTGRAQ